jgi:hypothetical protein
MGFSALGDNIDGAANVAIGDQALNSNLHGDFNTVVGFHAGLSVDGSDNIYIGATSGAGVVAESGTIRIGDPLHVSRCFIGGILNNGPFGCNVSIDPVTGQLGLGGCISSERFKKDIDPMDKASEAIFSLKPVTFHYKNDKNQHAPIWLDC